jgi:hypothetical protein
LINFEEFKTPFKNKCNKWCNIMKLEGFMIYLVQSKSTLPTENNFKDNAHKAFDKYKQYVSNQEPDVKDVYENFEVLYKSMTDNLSTFTVRNYTQCFLYALNLDILKMVFTEEDINRYTKIIKDFLKDANRTCNREKKKKKLSKQEITSQNEQETVEIENEPLTLSDIDENNDETSSQKSENSSQYSSRSSSRSFAHTRSYSHSNMSSRESHEHLMECLRQQQQQIVRDAAKIELLSKENERLWELVNKIVMIK